MEEKVEDYRDPEVLRRMYWDEGLSAAEIAERLYVAPPTVLDGMKRAGIPRRPKKPYRRSKVNYWDKAVVQGFIDKGMDNRQIARKAGVRTETIYKWVKRHGLTNQNVAQRGAPRSFDVGGRMMTSDEICAIAGICKTTLFDRARRGWKGEELLIPAERQGGGWKKRHGHNILD